ncbi:MAG: hypothetical protein WCO68_03010 [Verrucomicrobiota bacterium]
MTKLLFHIRAKVAILGLQVSVKASGSMPMPSTQQQDNRTL